MNEIASMMRDPVQDAGSCGSGCCVEIEEEGGTTKSRLLHLDESVVPENDPCQIYTCRVRSSLWLLGSKSFSYITAGVRTRSGADRMRNDSV